MPRIAIIHKEKCNPVGCGGYLCMRVCPINMKGEDCIVIGPDKKPIIDEILCTGCGICPNRCPFGAIDIINLPEALDKPPIHRYGKNGFHLYHLPVPLFGQVVGIIGRNGIGKSTVLKILAGQLAPNLGNETPASPHDLTAFFKGTPAQNYFEKLSAGNLTIAYKPQQVELIPRTTNGTVRQLLTKVDEKKHFDVVVTQCGIANILDNNIATLSGGELQRVAIAATALRSATAYIFDEPTSFLDIKQRINMSTFIKSLRHEHTAVFVVEHDLVILDFLTDNIHIMYGKPACYGVASLVKSSRNGINTFLNGFIREENMRFRNHEIKFLSKPPLDTKVLPILTSWTDISITLDKFTLHAPKGEIRKKEIIGVLGENGIGKTTFVKLLANVLTPKKGTIAANIRVSYKPQYLDSSSDDLVQNVLAETMQKYHHQLIEPLDITPLLTKQLNQLSGGELQRISIAQTLARDADLYLLDEPSAYLDVEQRLNISKIIRDFRDLTEKTILVVDHDIVFIDYISDRLIVCKGTPAREGHVEGPFSMEDGINTFLRDINITLRRDEETKRPRINKHESRKDREQKESGNLYYNYE